MNTVTPPDFPASDFGSIEARAIAHGAQLRYLDPVTPGLMDLVKGTSGARVDLDLGKDLHKLRAARMFKVPYDQVTETQRRYAKLTAYFEAYEPSPVKGA